MQIQEIPRAYVNFALGAARLPVTAAERVLHRSDDAQWPPTLAFEQAEASIKQAVGSLLRDSTLVSEGRLVEAKVARLREAAELEANAREVTERADRRLAAERDAEQQRLDEAERETQQRLDAARQDEIRRKQEVDEEIRAEERRMAEARQAEEAALAEKERSARAAQLSRDKAALHKKQEAAAARADVLAVDQTLEATKAARRNG